MQKSNNKYIPTYSSDWIHQLEELDHWILYWHQIRLIREYVNKEERILEVGIGTGFTANYLKSKRYNVTTFDIDKDKMPDIVGNIVDYKFDRKFDTVLAFEVFEHLPYDKLEYTLKNFSRSGINRIILSIPRNEKRWLDVEVKTPRFTKTFNISTIRNKINAAHHYWELDYQSYSMQKVLNSFSENNYTCLHQHKVKANVFIIFEHDD